MAAGVLVRGVVLALVLHISGVSRAAEATPMPAPGPVPGLVGPKLGVAGDVLSCGVDLPEAPDTAIAVHRAGAVLEAYVVSGVNTYRCTGTSMGRVRVDPATPVFGPSGIGFDRSYAGISAIVNPTADASFRIAYYHAEDQCPTDTARTAAAIGMAFSSDGGRSWWGRQQLVGSRDPRPACGRLGQLEPFTGVGQPTAILTGGYVYVLFTDWTPGQANSIGLVRAPAAQATSRGAYQKYNAGAWSPALAGTGSAVIARPNADHLYAAAPQVTYNTTLGAFMAIYESDLGFLTAASRDLIRWGPGNLVFGFEQRQHSKPKGALWQSYPSVLAADIGDPQVTGSSNYLYFGQGRWNTDPPQRHHMVRTWFAFGPPALPPGFGLGSGGSFSPSPAQSPYAWGCGGDVAISGPSGTQPLYDSRADTGVVVVLSSGNETTTVKAPYGASCRPDYPARRDALVSALVGETLRTGCNSSCARVRVVIIDAAGRVLSDQWR